MKRIPIKMLPEDVPLFVAIKEELDQNERKINRNMRVVICALAANVVCTAYVAYKLYRGLVQAWG